jgi:hypothetical protein
MKPSRRVSSKSAVRTKVPSNLEYIVLVPYFDRKAQETFCWCGRLIAKDREAARRRVERFLKNKKLVVDMFLGPAADEGGPEYVRQYFEQCLFDVGGAGGPRDGRVHLLA